MIKMHNFMLVLMGSINLSANVFAQEYAGAGQPPSGTIHTTKAVNVGCTTIKVSTKLGFYMGGRHCRYVTETTLHYIPDCLFYLNGGLLRMYAGAGYECAATHVVQTFTGKDAIDEYRLISDNNQDYVDTDPKVGQVDLKEHSA